MQWHTTPPVTGEHAVCIWLVKAFVDPDATFQNAPLAVGGEGLGLAASRVLGPTSRPGPFMRQHELADLPGLCEFLPTAIMIAEAKISAGRGPVEIDWIVTTLDSEYRALCSGSDQSRVLGALPVGVLVLSGGVIEYANLRAASMLGRSVGGLLHASIEDVGFQFTDHEGERLCTVARVLAKAGERAAPMEGLLCEVEGGGKFVGTLQRYVGRRMLLCLTDATRLITVERALRRSEERYRSLMDALPYGVEEFGVDGIITFANKALHKMMEYDEGELVGKPVWYFKKDENIRHELEPMLKQWAKEKPKPFAYFARNLTKSGREIDTRGDWDYQYDEQGNVVGYVGVVTDVTDITRREEDFRKMLDELYKLRNEHARFYKERMSASHMD